MLYNGHVEAKGSADAHLTSKWDDLIEHSEKNDWTFSEQHGSTGQMLISFNRVDLEVNLTFASWNDLQYIDIQAKCSHFCVQHLGNQWYRNV